MPTASFAGIAFLMVKGFAIGAERPSDSRMVNQLVTTGVDVRAMFGPFFWKY